MLTSTFRVAAMLALAYAAAFPAPAADITYTANPPRVLAKSDDASPHGLPACQTDDPTSPTPGVIYCYAPQYIWSAYNVLPVFGMGDGGQGQTIVIVDAFGSPTITTDLQAFDAVFGLPDPDFEIVCPMGCPRFNPKNIPQDQVGWTFETSLDVQWAHAIAPLAKIRLIIAPDPHGNSINNAVAYAVAHYPGSIISQSFGNAEASIHGNNIQLLQAHQNYTAAVANGITVLASSGDSGATNGLSVANAGYPASDPLVTAVGGTQGLPQGNLVALSGTCLPPAITSCTPTGYGAEQVWNEPWINSAGGGAVSVVFAPPSYQSGLGFSGRAVPDVAYNAAVDGGVLVAYSALGPAAAGFYIVGGTSAGAPQWAGIFALANTARASHGKAPLGFVNPALYAIGSASPDFHDITVGNNALSGSTGFSAGTGYDLATGLGTPSVAGLVNSLSALP